MEQLINIIPGAKTIKIQTDIQYNSEKEDSVKEDSAKEDNINQENVNKEERKPTTEEILHNKNGLRGDLLETNKDLNQEFINTKTQNEENLEKLNNELKCAIEELIDEEYEY